MKDKLDLGGKFYLECDRDNSGLHVVVCLLDEYCEGYIDDTEIDKEKATEIVLWLIEKFKVDIAMVLFTRLMQRGTTCPINTAGD